MPIQSRMNSSRRDTTPSADSLAELQGAIAANHGRLHALAYRMLRDHHAAEDAVQDACLRALQALDRFRGDASMSTWLYRITANVCLDTLRRRRPVVVDTSADWGEATPAEGDFTEEMATREELTGALAGLPSSLRQALLLTDVIGLDYADVSSMLGVPVGTVGSRRHRAKQAMRAALAPAA